MQEWLKECFKEFIAQNYPHQILFSQGILEREYRKLSKLAQRSFKNKYYQAEEIKQLQQKYFDLYLFGGCFNCSGAMVIAQAHLYFVNYQECLYLLFIEDKHHYNKILLDFKLFIQQGNTDVIRIKLL